MSPGRTRDVHLGESHEPAREVTQRGGLDARFTPAQASPSVFDAVIDAIAARVADRMTAPAGERGTLGPPLVSKQALAAALSCSSATIDRLVREHRVPYYVVGDSRRFDVNEVRAALRHSDAVSACGTSVAEGAARAPSARAADGVVWSPRRGGRPSRKEG